MFPPPSLQVGDWKQLCTSHVGVSIMYIATVGMRTCGVHCFRAMPSHLLRYIGDMQFSYGPLHVGVGGQDYPNQRTKVCSDFL